MARIRATVLPAKTAQFLDSATNLYDMRARVYDSTLGRFLQIDPAPSRPADPYVATYVYVKDSPTALSDPSGADFGCIGNWCVSDALKGAANFAAGAANFTTTTLTFGHLHVPAPFCGPGLHASYMSGEWTAGAEAVLYSVGKLPFNPESPRFGLE